MRLVRRGYQLREETGISGFREKRPCVEWKENGIIGLKGENFEESPSGQAYKEERMENMYLSRGAAKVVEVCAGVQAGEQVLVITEQSRMSIAQALASQVYRVGGEPVLCVMEPRRQDGQEPPRPIAEAMKGSDVFLSVVGRSITHTHAVKEAIAAGSRGLVLTQFTEEMMIHGGIEGDFKALKPVCIAMAQALAGTEKVLLTTPGGTHLEYSARGRRGNHLYCMVEKGQFSTLPTVEANVSPVEGSANGIIVADGSIPYIGIGVLEQPVILQVKEGRIIHIEGGRQAKMLAEDLAAKNDPQVYNVAEHGVGLNPCCHFCGFMLEDEGVYGSCHIGIGTSITLGGKVKASCHYDVIMKNGTIVADGRTLMENGKVLL